jgi:hypothetical protein
MSRILEKIYVGSGFEKNHFGSTTLLSASVREVNFYTGKSHVSFKGNLNNKKSWNIKGTLMGNEK